VLVNYYLICLEAFALHEMYSNINKYFKRVWIPWDENFWNLSTIVIVLKEKLFSWQLYPKRLSNNWRSWLSNEIYRRIESNKNKRKIKSNKKNNFFLSLFLIEENTKGRRKKFKTTSLTHRIVSFSYKFLVSYSFASTDPHFIKIYEKLNKEVKRGSKKKNNNKYCSWMKWKLSLYLILV